VTTDRLPPALHWAVEAAQNKKALGVTVLDLAQLGAFTGAFLLCTGTSVRQTHAISDEIQEQLERRGLRCAHREGSDTSEWILLDYRDFIVHIFTERARLFYDLERLWRSARRVDFPDEPAGAAQP
jgi:ribosome-associated protein